MRLMKTILNIERPALHVRIAYHRNRSHSSIGRRITGTGAAGRRGVSMWMFAARRLGAWHGRWVSRLKGIKCFGPNRFPCGSCAAEALFRARTGPASRAGRGSARPSRLGPGPGAGGRGARGLWQWWWWWGGSHRGRPGQLQRQARQTSASSPKDRL